MQPAVNAGAAEPMVDQVVFEALFGRAFRVSDAMAEQLRALGYDIKKPQPRYPVRVMRAAIELLRKAEFPGLAPEQASRQMGRRFIQGYSQTILGKVAAAVLPFLKQGDRGKTVERLFRATRKD